MLFLSLFKEGVLFAWQSLLGNKLRSFLSLLGITIGIFAIIAVFTFTDSMEMQIRNSIKSLGDNVVFVQKWPWVFSSDFAWWKYIERPVPNITELGELRKRIKKADACAFSVYFRITVKYKSSSVENADGIAMSDDYDRVRSFELDEGRYFSENELASGMPYIVIGHKIAEGLFPNEPPVGKEVVVRGLKFTVIGTFKKEGESMLGNNVDTQVLFPINYARNIVNLRSENFDPILWVKAKQGVSNDELIDELRGVMRAVRKLQPLADDDFALNQTSMLAAPTEEIFSFVGLAGLIIGGFSILVGGFGIANIMFVSVKERTHIIGIQKSLGAKNYFILLQFLAESIMLCFIGGVIGLLLILGAVSLLGLLDFRLELTGSNIILGMTISVMIGIISGFIPAYNASQLDPVEAIRENG